MESFIQDINVWFNEKGFLWGQIGMRSLILKGLVSGLIIALFIGPTVVCRDKSLLDPKSSLKITVKSQKFLCSKARREFLRRVCLNSKENRKRLCEFAKLKKEFIGIEEDLESSCVVDEALGILKELANSENVSKNKELRFGFILFAQQELPYFGFDEESIAEFIKELKWD